MKSSFDLLRLSRVTYLSLVTLVPSASLAQPAPTPQSNPTPQRRVIPPPPERSFLDPGPAPTQRRIPNYVGDDFITSPAYGPTDRFGAGELPPKIGESTR